MVVSCSILAQSTPNLTYFITSMCSLGPCGSRLLYTIINRLAPSPSRFETREWSQLGGHSSIFLMWGKVSEWGPKDSYTHICTKTPLWSVSLPPGRIKLVQLLSSKGQEQVSVEKLLCSTDIHLPHAHTSPTPPTERIIAWWETLLGGHGLEKFLHFLQAHIS